MRPWNGGTLIRHQAARINGIVIDRVRESFVASVKLVSRALVSTGLFQEHRLPCPNLDAVDIITKELNPLLLKMPGFKYKIIICGKNLPASYNNLAEYTDKNIIYAGFVQDINTYFMGADIFINPVTEGGGIKTKLAEALGMNLTAVSTATGAIGIPESIIGKKMSVIPDGDHAAFVDAIVNADISLKTPQEFFDHFYWANIAGRGNTILSQRP